MTNKIEEAIEEQETNRAWILREIKDVKRAIRFIEEEIQ